MSTEENPDVYAEMLLAIEHVPCPLGICLVAETVPCVNRPEETPAHRQRVGAYRAWLEGGGGA